LKSVGFLTDKDDNISTIVIKDADDEHVVDADGMVDF